MEEIVGVILGAIAEVFFSDFVVGAFRAVSRGLRWAGLGLLAVMLWPMQWVRRR